MSETLSHAPIDNTPENPASLTADQIKAQIDSLDFAELQVDSPAPSPLDRVSNALDHQISAKTTPRSEKKVERAAIRAGKLVELDGGDEDAIIDAMAAVIEEASRQTEEAETENDTSAVHPAVVDEAYRLNDKYDRQADRRQARAEKVEEAKQTLGAIGRAGIKAANRTFTSFATATEAAAGKVGNMVETSISNGIDWLEEAPQRKQAAEARKQARHIERQNAKQEKAEARLQVQRERAIARQERIDVEREEARKRANEAIVRKAERRQKWGARKDRTVGHVVSIGRGARRYGKRVVKTTAGAYAAGKDAWTAN